MWIVDYARYLRKKRRSPIGVARARGAQIADGVVLGPGCVLRSNLEIGTGTEMEANCVIRGAGACRIGRWAAIGRGVTILTSNHDINALNIHLPLAERIGSRSPRIASDVTVGHATWIGENVTILPGVTIGDGAVIGAGAVVTRDVPPFHIAYGVPAEPMRARFESAVVDLLSEVAWWNWPVDRMRRNRSLFDDLNFATRSAAEIRAAIVD